VQIFPSGRTFSECTCQHVFNYDERYCSISAVCTREINGSYFAYYIFEWSTWSCSSAYLNERFFTWMRFLTLYILPDVLLWEFSSIFMKHSIEMTVQSKATLLRIIFGQMVYVIVCSFEYGNRANLFPNFLYRVNSSRE